MFYFHRREVKGGEKKVKRKEKCFGKKRREREKV